MDLNALKSKMKDSGMSMTFIAKKLDISRASLYKKLDGTSEFRISEVISICDALHLTKEERNSIFFN